MPCTLPRPLVRIASLPREAHFTRCSRAAGDVKRYWRQRLDCIPYNASELPDQDCFDAAFLWWFFPVLVSLALLLFALMCRLLSRTLKPTAANPNIKLVKMLIQVRYRSGTKLLCCKHTSSLVVVCESSRPPSRNLA